MGGHTRGPIDVKVQHPLSHVPVGQEEINASWSERRGRKSGVAVPEIRPASNSTLGTTTKLLNLEVKIARNECWNHARNLSIKEWLTDPLAGEVVGGLSAIGATVDAIVYCRCCLRETTGRRRYAHCAWQADPTPLQF